MSPETVTQNAIGVILTVSGEVSLKSSEGLRLAESGSSVFRGDELITGVDGQVEVRFADDTLLSQGAQSAIFLDDYVYDEVDEESSDLFFKMGTGTFRMVTGKIAEQNPERFKIGSPLATIGIRGTITVHEIGPDGEKHGVEEIHSGKALLVQSIDGSIRQIASPRALVDIASSGLLSSVRVMTVAEFNQFQSIAPAAIREEQIIEEQREEELQEQQQQQEGEEQQGEGNSESPETQSEAGGEVLGGETMGLGGQGVLSGGEGVFGGQEPVDAAVLAAAEKIFEALEEGDAETASDLLKYYIIDATGDDTIYAGDDDIDELVEGAGLGQEDAGGGTTDESTGNDTGSSGDGIDWVLGAQTGEMWEGTDSTDYYDGRGGDDYIDGMQGDDTLKGGDGDDTIYGCMGNDSLEGGDGNDAISGNSGVDIVDAGPGNDYIFALLDGDTIYGGTGTDTVSYLYLTGDGVDANLATGVASGGTSDDSLSEIENLVGSGNNDILVGNGVPNSLSGLSGDDSIFGGAGVDNIDGGSGNDIIYGEDGDDTLLGGDGNDWIKGAEGHDTMRGGRGADTLIDDNGNDVFYYGALDEGDDWIPDYHNGFDDFHFSSGAFSATYGFADDISGSYDDYSGDLGSGAFFIFDGDKQLWYDPDADVAGDHVLIASVGTSDVLSGNIVVEGGMD